MAEVREVFDPNERGGNSEMLVNSLRESLESPEQISAGEIEVRLSEIFRVQAEVINPDPDELFILWRQYKYDHEAIFAKAAAIHANKCLEESVIDIGTMIFVPDSGSWLEAAFRSSFGDGIQYPSAVKTMRGPLYVEAGPDGIEILMSSLTYTERKENGDRKSVNIGVESFDPKSGDVLFVEDFLATAETTTLHVEGVSRHGVIRAHLAATVSVDVQGGFELLQASREFGEVIAPIRVTEVKGKGMNQIGTLK